MNSITEQFINIVYYNTDHSHSSECVVVLSEVFKVKWRLASTLQKVMIDFEEGCEFFVFHIDVIPKCLHTTVVEFINTITTLAKFIPNSRKLKIGTVITPNTPLSTVRTLQKVGVQGILLDINHYDMSEVNIAVNAYVNKIPYWPKHIIDRLPGAIRKTSVQGKIKLTTRQDQIFRLIKERGASNKVIAKALGISESTVKLHITEIFKKYGVRSRTQLAVFSNEAY